MCGRYVSPEQAAIERAFRLDRRSNPNPFVRRFNVAPSDTIPFLRQPSDSDGLELAAGRWGLVPHWWKDAKLPRLSFNARVEEAAKKPMWRHAWRHARCLIPAEGYYEWQEAKRTPTTGKTKQPKQPYFIRRADGALFCFAGLMSYWKDPTTGEAIRSCALLTTDSTGALADIHDRVPVILPESAYMAWLDRKFTDPAKVKTLADANVPPSEFTHWKVRLLVNNAKADGPELIEPLET
jgi:putative SOS response-associated peptidase YedK